MIKILNCDLLYNRSATVVVCTLTVYDAPESLVRGENFISSTELARVTLYSVTDALNLGISFPGLIFSFSKSALSISSQL